MAKFENGREYPFSRPQIINPAKIKPFSEIKSLDKRAAFILHIARFSCRKIHTLLNLDKNTISSYIAECYEKYPDVKRT